MKNNEFALIYLNIDLEYAKKNNLPVKLPILLEDYNTSIKANKIDIDTIIRGLETQMKVKSTKEKRDYYKSYLVFYYYEKFKKYITEKLFENADDLLEKIKLIHYDYRYHLYRGLYLKEKGHIELAELDLKQSLQMNKSSTITYELGNLMFERKIYDEALNYYLKSIEYDNSFLLAYLKISDVYTENGRYEDSILYLEKCLKIDKDFIPAYIRLGVIYNLVQRYKDANIIHNKALTIEPYNPELLYNNSFSLMKLGKYYASLNNLLKLKEKENKDYIYHEISLLYKNLGMFIESLEYEEKALELCVEENKEMILISLLKLSCILEEESIFYQIYNLLQNSTMKINAEIFKTFLDLSLGKIEDAKKTVSYLNNEGIFISLKERLDNLPAQIEKLESYVNLLISESIFESFNEDGTIIPQNLADNLIKKGFKDDYITWLKDSSVEPRTNPKGIVLIINCLYLSGFNYSLTERITTVIASYLWKDGPGIIFSRILLRFYQDRVFGDKNSIDIFLEENIEEIKELNYKFGRIISDYENYLMDYDSLTEIEIEDFETALKVFISSIRLDLDIKEINSSNFTSETTKEILKFVIHLNDF